MKLAELEGLYPSIKWREPIMASATRTAPAVMCCRVCIALHGLRTDEVPALSFPDEAAFLTHLKTHEDAP